MAYGYNAIMTYKYRFDVLEAVERPVKEFFNYLLGITAGKFSAMILLFSNLCHYVIFLMAYVYNALMT